MSHTVPTKTLSLLQDQIAHEFYAMTLYYAVGAYFEALGLDNLGAFFQKHALEEHGHAMRLYHHLLDRNALPRFGAVPAVEAVFTDPINAVEAAYLHEEKVTAQIQAIADAAAAISDHATYSFIQWFVDEQVEELDLISNLLAQVRLASGNSAALLLINHEIED